MKKIISLLLCIVLVSGCTKQPASTPQNMIIPEGAIKVYSQLPDGAVQVDVKPSQTHHHNENVTVEARGALSTYLINTAALLTTLIVASLLAQIPYIRHLVNFGFCTDSQTSKTLVALEKAANKISGVKNPS